MSSESTEPAENICVVCFKNVEIYSIGSCDHMVCYECSTRMRVLCRQNECPICRQELPKVVFTSTVKQFGEIQNCSPLEDQKFKICFQNKKIQDAFYRLLEHNCSICSDYPSFRTFQALHDHMKKQHELYYCDLCVEHLKIFTSERQCYTSKDLNQHQRKGDANDRSHRGHPLCQFCDVRYMDNDCLYRHLRRDHLYCHFCDADGLDLYYSSYEYLREHFQTEHYLCEEGSCIEEKFTRVFRTDIDLKAHRASAHGRTLGKAAAKQARTLDLEFTLKPRPRQADSAKRGRLGQSKESPVEGAYGGWEEELPQSSRAATMLPNLDSSEFPSLPSGSNSAPVLLPQQRGRGHNGMAVQFGRRNAPLDMTDENFPVLGNSDGPLPGTSMKMNGCQDKSGGSNKSGGSKSTSIQANHKSSRDQKIKDEFPSLSSSKKLQQNVNVVNWAKISNTKTDTSSSLKQSMSSTTKKTSKTPKLNGADDFPSLNSKFKANLNLKANEPTKTNFVNVKTYKNNNSNNGKGDSGGKEKILTVSVDNSWSEASDSLSVASTSSKAKSKKKKSKTNADTADKGEEKSDTAKKKTEIESANKSAKDSQNSALTAVQSGETVLGKPLPKVEDWFGDLRKHGSNSKGEDEVSDECNFTSANPRNGSTQFNFLLNPTVFSEKNNIVNNGSNSNSDLHDAKGSMHSKSDSVRPPPPPGFDALTGSFNNNNGNNNVNEAKRPPPGFSQKVANGFTFTNDSVQNFPIYPGFDYTPPADFEKRNQKLVSKVNKIIANDASLEQFKKKSLLFRQNLLTAKEYYDHCTSTMDEKGLQEVFPELLVLLPDIEKQQELFRVYSDSPNFPRGGKSLDVCVTCRQVIGAGDAKQHLINHSIEENFPSLKADWTK